MSIAQKTITVEGNEYLLTQFPASKGIRVLKQLSKLLGPIIAQVVSQDAGKTDVMGAAMSALFDNLDSVDIESLVKELVSTASKQNMAVNFDMEFAGNYGLLYKLVQEVVEFNFGSLFTLAGSPEA